MRAPVLAAALFLALPAAAQETPGFFSQLFGTDNAATDADQGSLIERLIEDQLSGEGRAVRIAGFSGALSGAARLERLTVADAEGVWLTLEDAVLDWNRGALFDGRLEVAELSAARILLSRLPEAGGGAPTPEAPGFRLPDLPVSVAIGRIAAGRVVLGAPVLGRPAEVALDGALRLAAGEGSADVMVRRLDAEGALRLKASYVDATGILGLDLGLEEGAGGILATLAGLPGHPPVAFSASGEAPIDAFTARILLATDGAERLTGEVTTSVPAGAPPGTLGLSLAVAGDIAPVFAPDYRRFFSDDIRLRARATRFPDGRLSVSELALATSLMSLEGRAEIGADGLPREIALAGTIAEVDGRSVLLPLPGTETRVGGAVLDIAFDAARSDRWSGRIAVEGLDRGALRAGRLAVSGEGRIGTGDVPEVTAELAFAAEALDPGDPALARALGPDISGALALDWRGGPLDLSRLRVAGADYSLAGKAAIVTGAEGPGIAGEMRLEAADLARLSDLLGIEAGGAAALDLVFDVAPLAGTFDIDARGSARDLAVGAPRLDPLIVGETRLRLGAVRDTAGLRIRLDELAGAAVTLTGHADLRSGGSTVAVAARLADAGRVLDGMDGPAELDLEAEEDRARDWRWRVEAALPGTALNATGRLDDPFGRPRGSATGHVRAEDLAPFSALAGRPVGGSFAADFTADATADLAEASLDLTGGGQDLRIGQPEIDRLLAGALTAGIAANRREGMVEIGRLAIDTPLFRATASGRLAGPESEIALDARIADIAGFASGFSGPLGLEGKVGQDAGGGYRLDLSATGPGGTRVRARGTAAPGLDAFDLGLEGDAPLGLANRLTAPGTLSGRAGFDLRLAGPPALASLSGTVTASGARFVAPDLGIALDDIQMNARLAAAVADVALAARVERGGRISVTGPVGLAVPHEARLAVVLDAVRLTDPRLYETVVAGRLAVDGPLADGARIAGSLALGETNIRIPTSGLGGAGDIPEVVHLNETPPIRGTRQRAGLIGANGNGPGAAYPLDVAISAPDRVFLRGRGLDSEFGGGLRLSGTTADTIPSGGFTLIRGRLDILGRRLALDEAVITIQGTFEPHVLLRASTEAEDYRVGVSVTGPASNPEFAFTSEPELPEEEVLARLIFGRGIETLSPLQAARLALAVRTLAGGGGEGVVDRIRRRSGLADLDVTTATDGTAALRAGAYLGERLYTDVTVGAGGDSEIRLNLDLSPSLTVKGGVRNDGATSLGVYFERDY